MIIRQDRSAAETEIVTALREVFDAAVSNFGAYNLLYAPLAPDSSGPSATTEQNTPALSAQLAVTGYLLGYKRTPPEMIVCPVDADEVLRAFHAGTDRSLKRDDDALSAAEGSPANSPPKPVETPFTVDMTNVTGLSIEDDLLRIGLSAGRRIQALIQPQVRLCAGPGGVLHQRLDVEDFGGFLDLLMDHLER